MVQRSAQSIQLAKLTITVVEPGIIENSVKAGVTLECEDIAEVKKHNIEISGGKPYAVLVVSGALSTITKEARELAATKEFALTAKAKALLVDSLGHRIVGSFYIRVNKPFVRTKIFTDRDLALAWLRQQLAKSYPGPYANN